QVGLGAVPWLEQIRSGQWSGKLRYRWEPASAAWSGAVDVSDAQIQIPGLADPLQLSAAHAVLDGPRVVLDRIEGQAGKIAFTGDYRYQPNAARPHWVRLHAEEVDAADLEAELMPTLTRSSSLIARALGRSAVPDWMRQRSVDGTVQI